MESVIEFFSNSSGSLEWLFVLLILLAGLNVPVSVDIILITAGAYFSASHPERLPMLFVLLFFSCWISAWEAYWMGRILGPRLYKIRWFNYILNEKRVEKLNSYYDKFGFFTFLVGRFIPGGVRNALFLTSGLGKMPFLTFILRDFPACFLASACIFSIGCFSGQHLDVIVAAFKKFNYIILALAAPLLIGVGIRLFISRNDRRRHDLKIVPLDVDCD